MKRFYRHYFLLFPLAARSLNLAGYDFVVSSCYGFAKMAVKAPGAVHICYCHTPTRWIWRFDDYASRETFNPLARRLLKLIVGKLKKVDLAAAKNVDVFIANSNVVADRIKQYYGRDAVIIFPPIQVSRFQPTDEVEDFYLLVSRLSAYKRIDLAIAACNALGRRLVIVGDGPDRKRLESLAGPLTTFAGRLPDAEVNRLMARCRAFLFPGEEDFGLTPLEVSASGRPTIAYGKGGALDTVVPGLNGLHFAEPTPASLADAITASEAITWDSCAIRHHAEQFDVAVFQRQFEEATRGHAL